MREREEQRNLLRVQCASRVLLIGKHEQYGVFQLVFLEQIRQLRLGRCALTSNIAINSCFAIPSLSESQLSTTKMIASVFG
jgi:hypothetical protein